MSVQAQSPPSRGPSSQTAMPSRAHDHAEARHEGGEERAGELHAPMVPVRATRGHGTGCPCPGSGHRTVAARDEISRRSTYPLDPGGHMSTASSTTLPDSVARPLSGSLATPAAVVGAALVLAGDAYHLFVLDDRPTQAGTAAYTGHGVAIMLGLLLLVLAALSVARPTRLSHAGSASPGDRQRPGRRRHLGRGRGGPGRDRRQRRHGSARRRHRRDTPRLRGWGLRAVRDRLGHASLSRCAPRWDRSRGSWWSGA